MKSSLPYSVMKPAQRLLYACCIVAVVVAACFSASAQNKPRLPGDLNQKSSAAEILTSLDHQKTFLSVGIVLKDSWDDFTYRPPWDDSKPAQNTFNFIPGFRVTNIDGCNLMLRHDDAKEVSRSKLEASPHRVVAEVWVQLNRMSPSKGKHAHRYTKDPEQVRLLGAWRTEFKYRGWFSRTIVGLTLHSAEWKEPQRWEGVNVAFTFATKEMGEKFDAAVRQAIRLCKSK